MWKRIVIIPLVVLALVGCGRFGNVNGIRGSGTVITETRSVSGFTGVALANVGELKITQGTTEGLTITAEDNILPHLTSQVKDGVLVLGDDTGPGTTLAPTKPIVYDLQVINLNDVTVSGAGVVSAPSLTSDALKLTMSGAGKLDLTGVQATSVTSTISGAGSVTLAGKTTSLDLLLSGLGNFQAGDLESETASVNLSGAGNATVWASKSLDVKISGAGGVSYYGTPQISQSITGVGNVRKAGDK